MFSKAQMRQEYKNLIVELVQLFRPHTYCEIGVGSGRVYNSVVPFVKRAVAVDIKPFKGIKKGEGRLHFCMDSEKFARIWGLKEDPTIDFLFIDADHHHIKVMDDFYNLQGFVHEHTGLILLHDTYPINRGLLSDDRCGTAWRAAKEIREHWTNFEIVTLPGPVAGLSIIRKARNHGWMDE